MARIQRGCSHFAASSEIIIPDIMSAWHFSIGSIRIAQKSVVENDIAKKRFNVDLSKLLPTEGFRDVNNLVFTGIRCHNNIGCAIRQFKY